MTREGEREGSDRRPSASYWQRKVEEYFRPEFVNRIDQIVVFDPLGVETVRQIARRELGEVMLRQGLVRRNLLLEVDDNVVDLLLDQGFNTAYGARPLKRAVERLVVLPLARYLASRGRVESDLLRLERRGNEVVLSASRLSGEERTAEVLLGGEMLAGGLKRRRVDDRDLVEAFAELRRQLQDWAERDAVVEMRNERAHLLAEINKPTFWDDGRAARGTMSRFYFLDRLLRRMQQLSDRADYLEELAGLVYRQRDARYRSELAENYERLARDCAFLEVELLCAHIVHNHRAVVLVRPVGPAVKEDGPFWASQLAGMYLRWAKRKGYDAEAALLEPLSEAERRSVRWDEDYPYRWRGLAAGDPDGLIKEVEGLPKFAELAILLEGTNIYGFLKGEAGVHRRNEQRPSGERTQQLVEVSIDASGEGGGAAWLEYVLERRAEAERELAKVKGKKPAAKTVAPEVVRVYQFEGQRHVRDLRTKVRNNDLMAVLEGDLDDFILAYLRETEAETAWDEPRE
jgi:protein subunit release factor A